MKRISPNQQAFTRTNSQERFSGFTRQKFHRFSGGFTIIELMIATTVFSVILLLVTSGIVQIGKTYYKGAAQSRTQETARSIIDEISRGIQFSGETVQPTTTLNITDPPYPQPGGMYGFCVNGVSYAYILDKQLASPPVGADQAGKTLISYSGTCNAFTVENITTTLVPAKELLGLGMRLTDLNVQDNNNGTYTITVGVASGERDLFDPDPPAISSLCSLGPGKQFCAISKLTTTVQKRVK